MALTIHIIHEYALIYEGKHFCESVLREISCLEEIPNVITKLVMQVLSYLSANYI